MTNLILTTNDLNNLLGSFMPFDTEKESFWTGQSKNEKYYGYYFNQYGLASIYSNLQYLKITQFNRKPASFIDLGCGIPRIPLIAKLFGFQACGLEFDKDTYDAVKNNDFRIPVIKGDMINFNCRDYDVIYFYVPIIDEGLMRKAFNNIVKTMKKGAYLMPYGYSRNDERLQKVENANVLYQKR